MLRDPPPRDNEPAIAALQCAPMDGIEVVDIAHAIDLAVAPVFLLSGIGVLPGVLTNRLARIVDRARYINASITLGTIAALRIGSP
jgi:hypothetical protein